MKHCTRLSCTPIWAPRGQNACDLSTDTFVQTSYRNPPRCKRRASSSNELDQHVRPSSPLVQISAGNHHMCMRMASSSNDLDRHAPPCFSWIRTWLDNHLLCKRRVSSSNGLQSLHFVQISADNYPLCKRKASSSNELHQSVSPCDSSTQT